MDNTYNVIYRQVPQYLGKVQRGLLWFLIEADMALYTSFTTIVIILGVPVMLNNMPTCFQHAYLSSIPALELIPGPEISNWSYNIV